MNEIMTGKEIVDDILEHHGILGMKWGVRRYQNKDGSLTQAGKKRYDDDPDNDGTKTETDADKRARLLKSTDAKEIYENRHLLSTNELNERLNRIDTEARLASKIPTEKTKTGNDKMRDVKQTIDNVTNLYRSVDSAYSTVANSAIGKTLAKKLGLDIPKKEFNLEEVWENRNKMSKQDIADAANRVENYNKLETRLNKEKERANLKTDDEKLKDAQSQVDDYINSGRKDDKVTTDSKNRDRNNKYSMPESEPSSPTAYRAKGKDIVDRVLYPEGKQLPAVMDVDMVENGQSHVDSLLKSLERQLGHSDLEDLIYLAHHGVKGQKWGVRRFQNKDGSLTAAGKKRYEDNLDNDIEPNSSKVKLSKDFDEAVKNYKFSRDRYGNYESLELTTNVGNNKSVRISIDIANDVDKTNLRSVVSKAEEFIKKYADDNVRNSLAKEYYDNDYMRDEWVNDGMTRSNFKSGLELENIRITPEWDTYHATYYDNVNYMHWLNAEGNLSDGKVGSVWMDG